MLRVHVAEPALEILSLADTYGADQTYGLPIATGEYQRDDSLKLSDGGLNMCHVESLPRDQLVDKVSEQ